MLSYLIDKYTTAKLKARYQRIIQEQVIHLIESNAPQPVSEDPGNWLLMGDTKLNNTETERADIRTRARRLVNNNPHARNILNLLECYVVGPDTQLHHQMINSTDADAQKLTKQAASLWDDFLKENQRHFSYREYARRTWRDGECFLRFFHSADSTLAIRFVDPEAIAATTGFPDSHGILTEPDDVEKTTAYLLVNSMNGDVKEVIPAEEMIHTKIGVDSNQKRGVSRFASLLDSLDSFEQWLDIELQARKLQASIVLWRKVQGSPSQVSAVADSAQVSSINDSAGSVRRERFRPGTILTTSQGTELQFLQPGTNFSDAVPLGRTLLLCAAAGAGLPEFMVTADASNANFASTMIAEGPAVKMFQSEQTFFANQFQQIWKHVMTSAIGQGILPMDFFERVEIHWSFPQLVNRDRPKERTADVKLVNARVLSRAEVARRDNADPQTMRNEIQTEEAS
ncbi:Bacteriophage capsid protein [hydrothermal vent metagenome]|uniref:Bacteriophage capsid protein n=1 Tax=hydrothermal vent metagenome TaxID=652676 RepID=A0A3B1DYV2_9ZZZZ